MDLTSRILPILSSIRIMQNLIPRLLNNKIKSTEQLPNKLNVVMKKGINNINLPSNIRNILISYWNKSGKTLKDYRDNFHHIIPLIKRTYLLTDKPEKILILFPDNPDVKNRQKFEYNMNINAIEYLNEAFKDFHDFLELISEAFGYKPTPFKKEIRIYEYGLYKNLIDKGTIALMIKNVTKNTGLRINIEGGELKFENIEPNGKKTQKKEEP